MPPTKKPSEKPNKGSSSKGKGSKESKDVSSSSKLKPATAINSRHILVSYPLPLLPPTHSPILMSNVESARNIQRKKRLWKNCGMVPNSTKWHVNFQRIKLDKAVR